MLPGTDSQTFRFSGTLAFEEYLEGHKVLAAKRRLWVHVIVSGYGLILIGYAATTWWTALSGVLCGIGGLMVVYPFGFSRLLFRYRVRRLWDLYPRVRREFDISISADGFVATDDKGNPVHTKWEHFIAFRESRLLFLLYLSPLHPYCLPKRLLPRERLPEFREFAARFAGD